MMLSSLITKGALSMAMLALPVVSSSVRISAASITPTVFAAEEQQTQVEPAKADPEPPIAVPKPVVEEPVKTYTVAVTAYSSTPDQTDDTPFITANGSRVRDGIVATNFLPFHTRVRFPDLYGDKVFLVEDRMNARYATRMDIWMPTRKEAIKFGLKRSVKVEVLPKVVVQK